MTMQNSDVPSLTVRELQGANYIASQLFHHGAGKIVRHDLASYLVTARVVFEAAMSAAEQSTDAETPRGLFQSRYMRPTHAAQCWPWLE